MLKYKQKNVGKFWTGRFQLNIFGKTAVRRRRKAIGTLRKKKSARLQFSLTILRPFFIVENQSFPNGKNQSFPDGEYKTSEEYKTSGKHKTLGKYKTSTEQRGT